MEDKSEKADYYCRIDKLEGVPGLSIRFSLTAKCAGESISINELSLKFSGTGELLKVFYEKEGIQEESASGARIEKNVKLRTDESMKGWFAGLGENGTVMLTCEDFAELCPVSFVAEKDNLVLKLYDGTEEPYKMIQGSATTHHVRIIKSDIRDREKIREAGTASLNILMPVCTPDWYCSSKAFGNIAKSDKEKFPRFESIVESNFKYVNGYQLTNKLAIQVGLRKSFSFCKTSS